MLQQMRNWFRYLKWLLVVIIFMFVWWAVAVYDGGISSSRQSDGGTWAAKVNGTAIPLETLQMQARRLDSMYQSILGDQYAQQRGMFRVGRQSVEALIEQELMYQEARRQGLRVSPGEVADAIRRDPNFQENGTFIGRERYLGLFRGNTATVEDYEEERRRNLLVEKARALVEDAVVVTHAEVEDEFRRRNEKTDVEYVIVDAAALRPRSDPTSADLERFYREHADRYARGEGRTGRYVVFDAASAAGGDPTDAELAAAYEAARATRFDQKEQRRASHILFKAAPGDSPAAAAAERKARRVAAQAKSGADFAALALQNSEDTTARAGGDLGFFGRGQMVREFEDAAFALPVGSVGDVVRSPYGFHVIKVTETRAPRTIPLEEAAPQLREELRLQKGRAAAARRAADFARAAQSGGGVETVARSQELPIQETGAVRAGDALPSLIASQPVVARMMSMTPGQVSDPIPTPSGPVVVQVTGTAPSEPRPLDEVRARVVEDLRRDQARAALETAVRSARGGGGLKALATRYKTTVRTQADLLRGAPLPEVPADPALETQLATLAPGAIGEPVATPSGFVVVRVKDRRENRDAFATQQDDIRDGLARQRRDRFYRAFVRTLRDRGEVVLNDPAIDAIDRV